MRRGDSAEGEREYVAECVALEVVAAKVGDGIELAAEDGEHAEGHVEHVTREG